MAGMLDTMAAMEERLGLALGFKFGGLRVSTFKRGDLLAVYGQTSATPAKKEGCHRTSRKLE